MGSKFKEARMQLQLLYHVVGCTGQQRFEDGRPRRMHQPWTPAAEPLWGTCTCRSLPACNSDNAPISRASRRSPLIPTTRRHRKKASRHLHLLRRPRPSLSSSTGSRQCTTASCMRTALSAASRLQKFLEGAYRKKEKECQGT
jgi:hypothetical protein